MFFKLQFLQLFLIHLITVVVFDVFFLCRRKKKSAFIRLSQSQNNCINSKPYLDVWRSGWELRTQLGLCKSIALTI
jgi:hypothetical protein